MKIHPKYLCIARALIIVAVMFPMSSLRTSAQALSPWSPLQRIPGYNDETVPPYLVADQNRTIHAFSDQQIGDGEKEIAVIYNQWTLEQGWTAPIDILLSPIKHEARIMGAFLDQRGEMHIIFTGGDETEANIYYSTAPALRAGQAPAWSTPTILGEGAVSPRAAALTGNDKGELFVLYSGNSEGNGLYGVYSNDSGLSWSDAVPIYQTYNDLLWPWGLRITLGQSGDVHAIWSVVDVGGQGRAIYYAKFVPELLEWGQPIELAETPTGLGVLHPNVVEHRGTVFALFIETPKVTVRRSIDGGETWTDPVAPFAQHVGVNGQLSVVVDGNDDLHLFWGQRISGNPDIHGMWHSKWQGNDQWFGPDAVVSGPRIFDLTGYTGFDPFDASAVASQGDIILVTWRTDPGGIRPNGVWYSYSTVDAPALPLVPLPTQSVITIEKSVATEQPASEILQEPTAAVQLTTAQNVSVSIALAETQTRNNPALVLISGLMPVVLLVAITMIVTVRSRRHKHE